MANKLYKEENIQAIGNAIRTKGGTSALLKVEDMAQAIADIPEPTGTQTVTENGTYNITNKKYVAVNVPQTGIEPQGTITITQNGTHNVRNYEYASVNVDSTSFKVNPMYCDSKIMPDTHNCGCHGTLTEYEGSDMIYVGDSFPEVTENVFFNHGYLYLNKSNYTHDFVFRNCKFDATKADGTGNYTYCVQATSGVNANIRFINCTFTGAKSAANSGEIVGDERFGCMTFNNCYIYNMQGDGLKGSNTKIYDTYVGVCGLLQGAHADGVQYSKSANCLIDGYRCDNIEFGSDKVANSSVLLGLDSGSVTTSSNVTLKDAYVNGGGNTIIIGPDGGYSMPSVTLNNIMYGCSYRYHPTSIQPGIEYDATQIKQASKAFIGSVWKEDNNIHFIACNYTNESRHLIIKTNNGVYDKTIDKCPTYAEYMADRETYAWDDDFPFNVEFTVPDADYIVIFDGAMSSSNQIRFVNWTSEDVYIEPFTPTGTLSITANGEYNVTNYANAVVNVPSETEIPSTWRTGTFKVTERTADAQTISFDALPSTVVSAFVLIIPEEPVPTSGTAYNIVGRQSFGGNPVLAYNYQGVYSGNVADSNCPLTINFESHTFTWGSATGNYRFDPNVTYRYFVIPR